MGEYPVGQTEQGNPVLNGNLAWLDCQIWAEHDAGDHIVVLGQVIEMGTADVHADEPLLYFKGQYRQLHHSRLNRVSGRTMTPAAPTDPGPQPV